MSPKRKISKAGKSPKRVQIESPLRHDDLPATVGSVKEVRGELIAEIRSVDHKVSSIDPKVESLQHQMISMENRLDGRIDLVLSSVHRTQALMEEQRGENRIVLDGIKSVMEHQYRAEEEAKEFRHTLQILVKATERTA